MERGTHWCTYIRRIEKRWREERREEGSEWWFVEKGGGRGVITPLPPPFKEDAT